VVGLLLVLTASIGLVWNNWLQSRTQE